MDIKAKVVVHRMDIYPCQACRAVFLCQDDLNQHATKHNNISDRGVLELNNDTRFKRSSLGVYDTSFATRSFPVNKNNELVCSRGCERKNYSKIRTSNGKCKSNYDVNKEDVDSKKQELESEISIKPEYTFFIKNEPQSILSTCSTNLRSKRISKPPPDKTRLDVLKSAICKKGRLKAFEKHDEKQITNNSNNQYSCGQCAQSFRTLKKIKSHLETHLDPSFVCDKCPESFITLRQLNRHLLHTHSAKNDIKCNVCQKKLKTNRNLRLHQLTHTGEKPFPCKQCGKRFTQNGSLQMHMKIHLGLKEHVCEYCNKAFTEYKNMKNHERTHTKERPFECRFCKKRFGDSSALIRHIRIHTGNKLYQCQQCDMKFSDPSGLTAHKKRHSGVKSYACDFCDKNFTTHHILANHESSVHMKLEKFKCELCKRNFTLKQYLKNHIVRMHTQNMECGVCKMKFYCNSYLEKHKAKGCVKDKYMCDYCGDKFSLKTCLRRHMEEKHSEPVFCHVCLKKYYTDYDLQKHKSKKRCVKKYKNSE